MTPAGVLSVALLLTAPGESPRLPKGTELTYTGTVTEAVDRPGQRYRRAHDLEVRVLVLDRQATWADAAVLTLLRRTDEPADPGRPPSPPAARLDLVRLPDDGPPHLIAPPGPAPLRLAADLPARRFPPVPLDSFAPFEFGMIPDPAAPWEPAGFAFVAAERCRELRLVRQSADWDRPRGGETAWRRAETVWASARDGTARRVERTVCQRDGIGPAPAVLIETRYELKDQARVLGRTFDRYRREVELAYATAEEVAPLVRDAAKLPAKTFDARLVRLASYLDETDPGTPYREAVLAVRRQLEAARRGETVPVGTAYPAGPTGSGADPRP
ncbi:MAG: hypothetical protein K2X87_23910 [Gemmataceae bacterium]|nr:hypothetical protein [Gemmataceae bacterium]